MQASLADVGVALPLRRAFLQRAQQQVDVAAVAVEEGGVVAAVATAACLMPFALAHRGCGTGWCGCPRPRRRAPPGRCRSARRSALGHAVRLGLFGQHLHLAGAGCGDTARSARHHRRHQHAQETLAVLPAVGPAWPGASSGRGRSALPRSRPPPVPGTAAAGAACRVVASPTRARQSGAPPAA